MKRSRTRRPAAPAAPAHSTRRRLSASRQRQRLIDACISALHLYGPSRTTVARVVAIAKLSPGIVRFYFKSKGAMLVASLRFLAAEFEERVMEPVGQLRDTPARALEKLVELYLDPDIASARKVSVWYAFWGESTARREYQEICGQKDERFAILVHELIGRMIGESGLRHLNSDAIALGLMGALEVLWQGITFQSEDDVDRAGARRRCMAYLASVFPGYFPMSAATSDWRDLPDELRHALERSRCFAAAWQLIGHAQEIAGQGDYLTIELCGARALALRDGNLIRILHNKCPQQPHVLVRQRHGRLAGTIRCPLHRLEFTLDGHATDEHAGTSLVAMESVVASGFLFAGNGAAPAPDLEGGGPSAWQPGGAVAVPAEFQELEIAADWKIMVEQLLLHRLADHDSAAGLLRVSSPVITIDAERRRIDWRATALGGECWSARRLAILASGNSTWERCFLWPNLLLERRPDGFSALQVVPLAAQRCRLQCFDYALEDAPGDARAVQFLSRRIRRSALRLDVELAVSTQSGLSVPGYASSGEPSTARSVAAFRGWLAAALQSPQIF
jgi:TetR/AcrR family transcriptional repressor of bet genes